MRGSRWNSFWLKVIYIHFKTFPKAVLISASSFCSPLILIYFIKSLGGALWMLLDSLLSAIRLRFQQCVCVLPLSCGSLCQLWTVAHQTPLSMEFSRQEYWSGLPFPSPGDLPNPETDLVSPALTEDRVFITAPPGKRFKSKVISYIPQRLVSFTMKGQCHIL